MVMRKKWTDIVEYLLVAGIIICLNILLLKYFFRVDLTEDKRYSVAPVTKNILKNLDEKVYVEVFLAGDLDPDYDRLRKSVEEKLQEFKIYSKKGLEFRFFDPNSIEDKKVRENFYSQLVQKGLQYRYHLEEKGGKKEEKIIFPGALISYNDREVPVMFLKGKKTIPLQQELNQAVESTEFELVSGLRRLTSGEHKNIAFVEGHGELKQQEVQDVSASLSETYNVDRIRLSDSANLKNYKVLIIASPDTGFSEAEKFRLDQYIMKGGNVLFMVDALNVYQDSLKNGVTYALPYNLNLDDMLFRYGVRLNATLIQDKYSGVLRVQTAGEQSQVFNYPFYPVLYNFGNHPAVRNLDAVLTKFIGTIDTVKAVGIVKTPLVYTSEGTKVLNTPIQINLNDLRKNESEQFNGGKMAAGFLLEGSFSSAFENKPLPVAGASLISKGEKSRIIVIPDGDIIRSETDPIGKRTVPAGYDLNMRYQFSNKEFFLNLVDYLAGEEIVNVRGKEIKLRPLDKEEINENKGFWQALNLGVPVILIISFGILRHYIRKKRYTKFEA
jgi:ABC-2 type transport system permease protein